MKDDQEFRLDYLTAKEAIDIVQFSTKYGDLNKLTDNLIRIFRSIRNLSSFGQYEANFENMRLTDDEKNILFEMGYMIRHNNYGDQSKFTVIWQYENR